MMLYRRSTSLHSPWGIIYIFVYVGDIPLAELYEMV